MPHPKITLTREKETLLIPLYGKALESRRDQPILADPMAESIVARVDYDFDRLRVPAKTRIMMAMRAKKLDACTRGFLAQHGNATVLNLGCGLDSRVARVEHPAVQWYDLDYPDVIELRRLFYEETATYHMLGSSVTDFRWMGAVAASGPAMIVAEGLLMYLDGEEVEALLRRLRERFPGSPLAFDAFTTSIAKRVTRHPSLKQTGAAIKWGIDDPREIEGWGSGIRLLEEWSFSQSEDLARLGPVYRILFKLSGLVPAARRAHRILRYQL